jgi:ABC-type Fe3+-hydroxamate transport system substrate-binding protein
MGCTLMRNVKICGRKSPHKLLALICIFACFPVLTLAAADTSVDVKAVNRAALQAFDSKHAERIVSLSPAATEILCAVGAFNRIAARTDFCNYPENVQTLPSIGGFDGKTLSIEKIISYRPDLVYATYGMHDYLVGTLRSYGIQVYISDASFIKDVLAEIDGIGRITGHEADAAVVRNHITSVLDAVSTKIQGAATPGVYWEVWNQPYMSAGKNAFMNDLITSAGGSNIFADINQAYPVVSEETIIARKPDVILIPDTESITPQSVQNRAGWSSIPAVSSGRIIRINSDVTTRPGPRIADAVRILAKAIHPEISFDGIK